MLGKNQRKQADDIKKCHFMGKNTNLSSAETAQGLGKIN